MHHGEQQLGGTFYGKLVGLLTSCSVWVCTDDDVGYITTINPGVSAIGWGQSGGNAYMRRVGAARTGAIQNLVTTYMVDNNGTAPTLPAVNVAQFIGNVATI